MNMESMQDHLSWDFVAAMMSQSVVVVSVANTLGAVFKNRLSRTTTAFIASLMLTSYAAFKDGGDWGFGRVLETLAYAVMLFCLSAGAQQSVVAVADRFAGRGAGPAAAPGPAAARGGARWWESWF
jgi:hypothetical protein